MLGEEAAPAHSGHAEDVNGDGRDDMVLHFRIQELGIDPTGPAGAEFELLLLGWAVDGLGIIGWDSLYIVNGSDKGKKK